MAIQDEVDLYTNYYLNQADGSFSLYNGSAYQRGHGGIGSFLSGLFRFVLPMLKKGGEQIAKEVVRTSFNVVQDMEGDTDFKTSLRRRGLEGIQNLQTRALEAMNGSGLYKRTRKRRATTHSGSNRVVKRTKLTRKKAVKKSKKSKPRQRKKKSSRKHDIFD